MDCPKSMMEPLRPRNLPPLSCGGASPVASSGPPQSLTQHICEPQQQAPPKQPLASTAGAEGGSSASHRSRGVDAPACGSPVICGAVNAWSTSDVLKAVVRSDSPPADSSPVLVLDRAASPPPPLGRSLFDLICEEDGWDQPEDAAALGTTLKLPATMLACTLGKTGVASLGPLGDVSSLTLTRSFGETLSAASAVHGADRKWVRGETIGRGSMGIVFQAMDQQSGQVIAVKEVIINQHDEADLKFKQQLANEIDICKDLKHPRIVAYLGHDTIEGSLCIYTEYMAGGSMADVLQQFGIFEESLIACYTRALLEGLEYLHTRTPCPVVHRDVKSANVLVGLDARVKLADFGCSKRTSDTLMRTMRGSIPWMAPEVVTNTGYGRRADIWSFGCVMIEMATAAKPWGKFDNPMAAMLKIGMSKETPPLPQHVSDTCRNFIRSCVQREKEQRPSASELLQHEFVVDLLVDD